MNTEVVLTSEDVRFIARNIKEAIKNGIRKSINIRAFRKG